MAQLTKSILGTINGSIPNLTFRRVNGKVFIISKHASHTTPVDADSVQRRNNFGSACRLASAINSVPLLRGCWQPVVHKRSTVFHTIVKSVFKTLKDGSVTPRTMLAPGADWNLCCPSYSRSDSQIDVTVELPEQSSIANRTTETALVLVVMQVFAAPVEKPDDASVFDVLVSEPHAIADGQPVHFVLPFSPHLLQLYERYRIHKMLLVLISTDTAGFPIGHSNTLMVE